ncbi:MAG: DNA topoisomerase, partial [Hominisplanchenecus sp.]
MYLVITEKPSVARSIADVIGVQKREDGYLEGKDCIVSWCLGHLAEYVAPDAYDEKFSSWNYEDLPIIPQEWKLAVSKDKKDQFYVLKKLLNRPDIDYVVNACDAGREGELIFKRVYDLSQSRKPVKRLWISSMEDEAIREGFSQMKDASAYENLADAAVCRAQADWLVGMNATRAYTSKYYKKLTVGRVQTPTLAMLVDRDRAVSSFQKEKYFNVELDLDGLQVERQKIFDEKEAEKLRALCQGSDAVVEEIRSTDKTVRPPKLYDLTTLQREANRHYGMTAQQTLNAAQSLYEQKLITYPRTDSQYLTEDMEVTAGNVIRRIHEKYQLTGPFDQPGKPNTRLVLNNRKVSDHHAIIPTVELTDCD